MKIAGILFVATIVMINLVVGIRQALALSRKRIKPCNGVIVVSKVTESNPETCQEDSQKLRIFWPHGLESRPLNPTKMPTI